MNRYQANWLNFTLKTLAGFQRNILICENKVGDLNADFQAVIDAAQKLNVAVRAKSERERNKHG